MIHINCVQILLLISFIIALQSPTVVRARHLPAERKSARAAVSALDDNETAIIQPSPEAYLSGGTPGEGQGRGLHRKRPKPCKKCGFGGGNDDSDDDESFSVGTGGDDDDDEDDWFQECFPATARVHLPNSRFSTMADLHVGDVVQLADSSEATVYGFSHRDEQASATFLRLVTPAGNLSVTRGHYVYNTKGRSREVGLSAAKDLSEGDRLVHLSGKLVPITDIILYQDKGLYNPHATQDELVVDGFRVSTFTLAVPPTTATSLLAPVRATFRAFSVDALTAPTSWYFRSLR